MRLLVKQQHSWETDSVLWVNMTYFGKGFSDFQMLNSMKPIQGWYGDIGQNGQKPEQAQAGGKRCLSGNRLWACRWLRGPSLRGCVHAKSLPWSPTLWDTMDLGIPVTLGFSRQESWSGLPCPPPEDLPNPRTEPCSLFSPALVGRFFTTGATWVGCCLFCLLFIQQCWGIGPVYATA